jgi:hypothetical protein
VGDHRQKLFPTCSGDAVRRIEPLVQALCVQFGSQIFNRQNAKTPGEEDGVSLGVGLLVTKTARPSESGPDPSPTHAPGLSRHPCIPVCTVSAEKWTSAAHRLWAWFDASAPHSAVWSTPQNLSFLTFSFLAVSPSPSSAPPKAGCYCDVLIDHQQAGSGELEFARDWSSRHSRYAVTTRHRT